MIFDLIQTGKEPFAADFQVMRGNVCCGNTRLSGKLGSMEGILDGQFGVDSVHMQRCTNRSVPNTSTVFRPYEILLNSGAFGYIYQTEQKNGWFDKFQFHQLQANGQYFNMYPIGFGEQGAKCPVYCGESQIALIEKECVVYNDLHQYHVLSLDESAGLIAYLFCNYMYTLACYEPGVQTKQSCAKYVSVTKNKTLLQKYNPNFIYQIQA